MRKQSSIRKKILSGFGLLMAYLPGGVRASTVAVYEWETLGQKIINSLTGPVAFYVSVGSIVACGIAMAFGDLQGGAKKTVGVLIAISFIIGAVPIVKSFLSFKGAIL